MLFNTSLTLLIASNLGYAPTFSFAETNKHIHFNLLNSKMLFSFSSLYRGGSQVQCNFQLDSFSHFLESPLIFEYDVISNIVPSEGTITNNTYEYDYGMNIHITNCIFDQCFSLTSGGCIKFNINTVHDFRITGCTFYNCSTNEHAAIMCTLTDWLRTDMRISQTCIKDCFTNCDRDADWDATVLFYISVGESKVFEMDTISFLNCQNPDPSRYGPHLRLYSNNFELKNINFSKNILPDSSCVIFNQYLKVGNKNIEYCQFENLQGLYLLNILDIEEGGSLNFHYNNIIDFHVDYIYHYEGALSAAVFMCNPSSSSVFKIENNNFHNLSVKNAIFALSNFIYLNNSGIYPGMSGNYVDSTTSVLTGTAGFILNDSLEYHLIPELDADRCNYPPIIDTPTPTEEEIIITPTEEEIIITPTEEEIIVTPTEEEIIITPTEEEIIITPTEEEIIITPTEEEIIITPTEEEIIITPTEEEIIITPTEEEIIITPTEEEIMVTPTEEEIIITPTVEEIIITPTEEEIMVTPTEEEIIITPTEEEIIITPTEEEIIITPTEEEIIVTPTEEEIIVTPTEEEIIITPTEEEIIITPTEEDIIITPTEEEIIIKPTQEEITPHISSEISQIDIVSTNEDEVKITSTINHQMSEDIKVETTGETNLEDTFASEILSKEMITSTRTNEVDIVTSSEEAMIENETSNEKSSLIIPSETNNHEIVTEENIKTKNQEETIDEEETINEEKTFQETIEEETSSHQDPNEGSGEEESKKNKISGGGIAGIIIGVLLLIAIIIFLVIFFMRRRNEDNTVEEHELDDETYETTAQTPQLAVGTSLTNSMFVTQEGMLSLESRISDDPFRIDIEEDVYSHVI